MTTTYYKDYPKSHALDLHETKQVGGSHYKLPIEPIDYIFKNNLGFMEGNVVKYVTRHKNKKGVEDIKKAIHYLELIIKYQYGENK